MFPIENSMESDSKRIYKISMPQDQLQENADAILTIKIMAGDIRPTGTASIEVIIDSPDAGSSTVTTQMHTRT